MKNNAFLELRERHTASRYADCDKKAISYTMNSDDRLNNFKVIGQQTGRNMKSVLQVYMAKHWLAIMAFINNSVETSTGIEESIHDVQNYLDLLLAMIEEERDE